MTKLTLGQAAKLAGVGKSTLSRAIKSGRLSASRQTDGSYRIDPAELERVYELKGPETDETGGATGGMVRDATPSKETPATPDVDAQVALLREMLARADQRADELKADRDAWRSQAEKAQMLLTDQRKGFWKRVVGG
jgi:excisionase family DNA binding protein